jgi:signal transduction histidine kinase
MYPAQRLHESSEAEAVAAVGAAADLRPRQTAARPFSRPLSRPVPLRLRLVGIVLLGALAAAGVGYLTSENPHALPSGVAVSGRVLTIMTLILTGVYAQTSGIQARMGRLLVSAGFLSCLWLLQGSSDRFAFSVGVLFAAPVVPMFFYLMLAHPTGWLHSQAERRLIAGAGGLAVFSWTVAVLTTPQPPLATPLLRCAPHCPGNALFLGFTTGALPVLRALIVVSWFTCAAGGVVLLARRMRLASPPARRSIAPVQLAAGFYAATLGGFLLAHVAAPRLAVTLGTVSTSVVILVPVAIVHGLVMERLFMGDSLEQFVNELSASAPSNLEALIGKTLGDRSLRIVYRRPAAGTYVDSTGAPTEMPVPGPHRAVTEIERDGRRVAMVIRDAELSDQDRFVQAVGVAAMMWFENAQLEADLRASLADLAASRERLVETADAERQRIERDLHDGVQQHLVGMRVRLELAREALEDKPQEGARMLAAIGRQMDDALEELRSLARGIYPPVLGEHGLGEALRSAGDRSPLAVSVRARRIGRYPTEVETAVYFCCLEALQNAGKHAGPGSDVTLHLSQEGQRLCFAVSDTGCGFTVGEVQSGTGLVNMKDRIEAIGGRLTVSSSIGDGTSVTGSIPIAHGSRSRKTALT